MLGCRSRSGHRSFASCRQTPNLSRHATQSRLRRIGEKRDAGVEVRKAILEPLEYRSLLDVHPYHGTEHDCSNACENEVNRHFHASNERTRSVLLTTSSTRTP
jgi:hypothetical protein